MSQLTDKKYYLLTGNPKNRSGYEFESDSVEEICRDLSIFAGPYQPPEVKMTPIVYVNDNIIGLVYDDSGRMINAELLENEPEVYHDGILVYKKKNN